MKVSMPRTRRVEMGCKYMPMETCMLGNTTRTKSMERELSSGSVFAKVQPLNRLVLRFSIMKDSGGADCLMEKVSMKNQMVNIR